MMKNFVKLIGLASFLSLSVNAAQIKLAPTPPGSPGPLAKFSPIETTGFSQLDDFVVRVREGALVELYEPAWLLNEQVTYIQRNPKSTFESPEFLIGGKTELNFLGFDRQSKIGGATVFRERLKDLSIEQQLEKAGFKKLSQPGLFTYLNEEGVELGYVLAKGGVLTHFLRRAEITLATREATALPVTLLGTGEDLIKGQFSRDKDVTRQCLLMENAIGKFRWRMTPTYYELSKPLDQLDDAAFGKDLVTVLKGLGNEQWEKNRDALNPPRSIQRIIDEADRIAASLPVSRQKLAAYLYRISTGLDYHYLEENVPFELSAGKKFKIGQGLETMGSVKTPIKLQMDVPLPNLIAELTNLSTGKKIQIDFAVAALIATYGVSQGDNHEDFPGYLKLEELAEFFK